MVWVCCRVSRVQAGGRTVGRDEVYGLEGSRVGTTAGAGELQRGIVCGVGDGDGHALNNPLARPPGDEGHALVEPV